MATALIRWFRVHARDLPWRRPEVRSGYAALVSEAMLQQTQVARVVPAFESFMARFPSIRVLAAAPEVEVLAAWNGLGYYRRARHLHAAAKAVCERYAGELPATVQALEALPGVGRYTAGAIASIVHGEPAPIVDGNVFRVLVRTHGKDATAGDRDDLEWAWSKSEELVRATSAPGVLNEALMELGATVCTPRAPRCGSCPVARMCVARHAGETESLPRPKKAARRKTIHHHVVPIVHRGRVLLTRRADAGLWASMYEAPTVESEDVLTARGVMCALGIDVGGTARLRDSFTHITTHRDVRFLVYEFDADEFGAAPPGPRMTAPLRDHTWCEMNAIDQLPMSNPQRRIVRDAVARAR